ncbi:ABC transporter substrate-binding protein [Nocardiopsis sp. TSRI0078]|uniref:zinc ABC transporter substrate-binding protein AztC n=1 Tax=unclassified Nocardiopsis TaxID=2649073 RepID=UPI00093AE614|nr:zinc ABC transporter substrate-binding protein AztC [Nocardiopsis sp. TSRI0078]OKI15717.1 ABC transporter substrate-binding protein [Nocardiopsis sp. TSRI0078]
MTTPPALLSRMTAAALAGAALLGSAACTPGADTGGGIVVTTNILGDITREVVGDQAEVTVLMRPNADPHSFALSAREAAVVENAALVVYNGLGLEEGVLRNVAAAEEAGVPALEVGAGVNPLSFAPAEHGHEGHGHEERAHGEHDQGENGHGDASAEAGNESAGEPDPHFWTDPRRVVLAVDLIAEHVVEQVGGVDADTVRANAAAYTAELEELDAWMAAEFAAVPEEDRKLVTNHHVFGYLAQRYGFEVIGTVIPSGTTLASPSTSDLKSLSDAVHEAGVNAVFADSSQPDRLATVMAEEAGTRVEVVPLFSESLSEEGQGAATYLEMMRANTESIATGLRGE